MKFEEFKSNEQDEYIKQDVYVTNRIQKTIEEMKLPDTEGGFELAKKYLIRNEKLSKKSYKNFLFNMLMRESIRGFELFAVFVLGLLSDFLSNRMNVGLESYVIKVIVILIMIRCVCSMLLKNQYNELEKFEIRILKDISYEQYKVLCMINIKDFSDIENSCKKRKAINSIKKFFIKLKCKIKQFINKDFVKDLVLWIGSIAYGAGLFLGMAIWKNVANFSIFCSISGVIVGLLEYSRYSKYDLINFDDSKNYNIFKKFKKPAYESCKLLSAPTFTVMLSIILLKVMNRTPQDVSDTVSNMSEQIVGSLFSVFIFIVYYFVLILLFNVINNIGKKINEWKKQRKVGR